MTVISLKERNIVSVIFFFYIGIAELMSTNYPSISEGKVIRGLLAVIPSLINHLSKVPSNKSIFLATLTQKRINCHLTFHLGGGGGGYIGKFTAGNQAVSLCCCHKPKHDFQTYIQDRHVICVFF